jgi:MauM/NapG family ferredoxin protein
MTNIIRRTIQGVVLLLFFISVWFAPSLHSGFFVQLDPLVALSWPIAARTLFWAILPGVIVILSAFIFGRIFCGYVCPMGTTIDIASVASKQQRKKFPSLGGGGLFVSKLKYLLLAAVLGGAFLGVNLYHWLSPIPLVTRFYSILIQPVTTLAGNNIVALGQPLFSALNFTGLEYWQIGVRRFDGLYFILIFFGTIFLLEIVRSRFWCRYICPAGGLLGLCSKLPLWRRRVNTCTQCGVCAKRCPTGAIDPKGKPTAHRDCITCQTCVNVCPVKGVEFSFKGDKAVTPDILPTRRAFIIAMGGGAGLAAVELLDLYTLTGAGDKGFVYPVAFVRPPGAVPESEFLVACIRCGLCMRVCPSNGLQPATSNAGANVGAEFSPILVSRRGACEPDCNLCGLICPTGAIRELSLQEKRWAKIGTAVVHQGRCVAWSADKSCMVCQEVCPFAAINIVQRADRQYPAPVVNANRCYGCGYCEQHCPTKLAAIVVEPLDTLRLSKGSFEETGRERGLRLEVLEKSGYAPDSLFIPDDEGGLPPGFSE